MSSYDGAPPEADYPNDLPRSGLRFGSWLGMTAVLIIVVLGLAYELQDRMVSTSGIGEHRPGTDMPVTARAPVTPSRP